MNNRALALTILISVTAGFGLGAHLQSRGSLNFLDRAKVGSPFADPKEKHVVIHDKNLSYPGVNIVVPFTKTEPGGTGCFAMNMEGRKLGQFPGHICRIGKMGLGMISEGRFTLYGPGLKPIFQADVPAHHHIEFSEARGEIFLSVLERIPGRQKAFDEVSYILGLDRTGKEIFRWRTMDHRLDLLKLYGNGDTDPDHYLEDIGKMDSIQVIEKEIPRLAHLGFKPGNLLVAFDLCSCLAVIDRATHEIVWSYKPFDEFRDNIHTASITPEGNIVYFRTNMSWMVRAFGYSYSEVFELDPLTGENVWSYRADKSGEFYSGWSGSVQKLPNGNYLISGGGAAFELTPDKHMVWKWVNPRRDPEGKPELFYRISRVDEAAWKPFQ